jgi:hypothetical protein
VWSAIEIASSVDDSMCLEFKTVNLS